MVGISVVVCTHNPRSDFLLRTLEGLQDQTLPRAHWELLIVDNASDTPVADRCDLSWHRAGRHVSEPKLGLTEARFRGIAETTGELVVFVDDDNVLAPDYLETALAVAAKFPHLGVFGSGTLEPEFETPPADAIRSYLPRLSLRAVPAPRWSNHVDDYATIPWGAGLVVRRSVADLYQSFTERLGITQLLGRRGKALYAGEDDLFSSVAIARGYGFGVFPQLQVTHLIGSQRLSGRHLVQLIHDHAFSTGVRHYVLGGTQPPRIDAFSVVHLLLHGSRRGFYAMRCRWAELRARHKAAQFIAARKVQPIRAEEPYAAAMRAPAAEAS